MLERIGSFGRNPPPRIGRINGAPAKARDNEC
jgi:hypothetical protein